MNITSSLGLLMSQVDISCEMPNFELEPPLRPLTNSSMLFSWLASEGDLEAGSNEDGLFAGVEVESSLFGASSLEAVEIVVVASEGEDLGKMLLNADPEAGGDPTGLGYGENLLVGCVLNLSGDM